MRPLIRQRLLFFLAAFFFSLSPSVALADRIEIKALKKLYLTTNLVESGHARAVIVAPRGGRYAAQVSLVRERIRRLTGVSVPVYGDDTVPEALLKEKNVIALGNMSTNRFIARLYCQWQVILDLKYPGNGGYVVRSLHNPYGTGHNVIFLGGSDDAGVVEAAHLFADSLQGNRSLKVGWLMKIRLGKGMTPPVIGAYLQKWNVQSWSDSRRTATDGTTTGYDPATFFGWNPISIAGALYYLTGKAEYLETFKDLALPDPRHLPLPNRTSDAFTDPVDPLVKSYHYRSHLVDCIYDLIEESPQFTDSERLQITNKLLDHQYELDKDHTFSAVNGDRHALWHMLCIYTGSRYFSRYYPNPLWEQRVGNVRRGFGSFIDNPTWAERDTLEWVSTSIEPVFEFFLLDGFDQFVKSGTARTYMNGLETLMTGEEIDDYNSSLPLNLLFKAAYLLDDGRYLWMANHLGADTGSFRIGQSFWPADTEARPPTDLVGKVSVVPLARSDREAAQTPVSAAEAFQLLSYRTGLEASDDYLQLDGFEGLGRHPYQLNTITRLRMFGGMNILSGYANDLAIWLNGMTESHVARSAALKQQLVTGGLAYIQTEVPDMPGSRWQRHILYLKGVGAVVVDRVIPCEAGSFDIVASWQMGGSLKRNGTPSRLVQSTNGAALVSADLLLLARSPAIVQGKISRELHQNEPLTLATLLFSNASPKVLSPLRQGGYLMTGTHSAFVGVGPYSSEGFSVKGDFAYIDPERIFLARATELALPGAILYRSEKPVTISWNIKEASVLVSASETTRIQLTIHGKRLEAIVQAGRHSLLPALPPQELAGRIRSQLKGLAAEMKISEIAKPREKASPADWQPAWEVDLKGKITVLASADKGEIWAASQEARTATLTRINGYGKPQKSISQAGELLSVWPAQGGTQRQAFSLLAGFRDDTLRAFAEDGKELWSARAAIHPSFQIGDRYDAPWFTDPRPPYNMTGVYSLLVGDQRGKGREEIVLGRPGTVEFRALDGSLHNRVPTRWGTNTLLAAMNSPQGPLLLAGKGYAGIPSVSGIDSRYQNASDDYFYYALAPGFPNMHAWQQRGMSGLQVVDIDGDGREEVVYTLSGHWNELRVYDNAGKPLWMKFFGPDKLGEGSRFMSALAVVDLDASGRKAIVVGTRNGWVTAFDHRGNLLWQNRFESSVTSIAGSAVRKMLVVGCDDGSIFSLNGNGRIMASGALNAPVRALLLTVDGIFAGSAQGLVRKYTLSWF